MRRISVDFMPIVSYAVLVGLVLALGIVTGVAVQRMERRQRRQLHPG